MKRATLKDVAAQAGVSYQTVSRVINNKGEVSPDTQQRVLAAAQTLNYSPSRVARSLVTRRTYTIGLALSDITNPFFPEMARGVQKLARTQDYNVFLCHTEDTSTGDLEALHSLAAQGVDGIILFGYYLTDSELNAFANNYRPIVLINRDFDHPNVSRVLVDNYRGAQLAVDHLVEQGHTAIGMISGPIVLQGETKRVRGFQDALADHHLTASPDWIVSADPTLEGGYKGAEQLLSLHPEITAIFTFNDVMAFGAMRACRDLGRTIPEGCAIVGFDDIQFSGVSTPSLTSVQVDKYSLGEQAMQRLLMMIDTPQTIFDPISIDVTLVARESTQGYIKEIDK